MSFTFRPAEDSDAEVIVAFQIAMAWETEKLKLDPATVAKGVAAVFERPEVGAYHICADRAQVVGVLLLLKEWSDWRNGSVFWIHSLYFKPEFRGQGLFTKMYAYVKAHAEADPSIRGIRLYVDRSNERAQAIYTSVGMNGDHYRLFEWMKTF